MTDPSHRPGPYGDDARVPRWVKVTGVVVAVAVVLAVAMMLTGGLGGHGPSRHGGMGATPPVTAQAHTPPAAGHR
ncbi:hypothetical protein ABGB17_09360 [Sphaerisporangium sp. B11E5]|uniref:hypothetical protein n=1 Tax=Sphaerisporangium sp. B11E5 TaxID=3153563 RepID=UPI00325DA89A